MRRRSLQAWLAAGLLAAVAGAAHAGALRVSPVGLDLADGRSAATLTLRNDDETPANIQIRVYRWSQTAGEDRLEPTDEVVASPPIATLNGHSERVVRVVRVTAAPPTSEQSYRLIVDELPPPPGDGGPRVRLLMRHSIPVFFNAGDAARPEVAWRGDISGDGLLLSGRNSGGRRLRVSNVRLLDAGRDQIVQHPGLLGYVLAGAEADWRFALPAPASARPARLVADTDGGPIDVALSPAP
jgi:fimbrial chaperone protein